MRDDVLPHLIYSYSFNLHSRLIKRIEPILAKKISIKKDRSLTPDKVLKLIADVTETYTAPQAWAKEIIFWQEEAAYLEDRNYYGRRREDIISIKSLQGQGT